MAKLEKKHEMRVLQIMPAEGWSVRFDGGDEEDFDCRLIAWALIEVEQKRSAEVLDSWNEVVGVIAGGVDQGTAETEVLWETPEAKFYWHERDRAGEEPIPRGTPSPEDLGLGGASLETPGLSKRDPD